MKFILCILITLTSVVHSQSINFPDYEILFLPQGFHAEAFPGTGFSTITSSSAHEIASGNPAAISFINNIAVGAGFEYQTSIDSALSSPYFKVGFSRIDQFLPQSAGLVFPLQQFKLGLGFSQKYSGSLDFDPIPLTTIIQPGGSGEYITPIFETRVYSGSGLLAFSTRHLFSENDRLHLGVQLMADYLKDYQEISNASATATDEALTWKLGFIYESVSRFNIGMIYEKGPHFEGEIEVESITTVIEPGSSFTPVELQQNFYGDLPDKFSAGITYFPHHRLAIAGSFSAIFWNKLHEIWRNQLDFSGSAYFHLSKDLVATAGVYLTDRNFKIVQENAGSFDATYLNAGLEYQNPGYSLQFILADNHISSSALRKRTRLKLGIEFYL